MVGICQNIFKMPFYFNSHHSTKTLNHFWSSNHSPMAASSAVSSVPKHQVFLNFRGKELRNHFISHLAKALRDKNIQIFIDEGAAKGQPLTNLFKEIEKSRIALAVFSKLYTESKWCLNELGKIKERTEEGKLVTIPIFYNVEPETVRYQAGEFGDALRKKETRGVTDDKMNRQSRAKV